MAVIAQTVSKSRKKNLFSQYRKELTNPFAMMSTIETGINTEVIFDIAEQFHVSRAKLAELLQITTRTLDNFRSGHTSAVLNANLTERALLIIQLYNKGIEVFESVERFNNWLEKPSYGLDEKVPVKLIKTAVGIDLVMRELTKIEYGDFS